MPRKDHTEQQILQALRRMESGEKAVEICLSSASATTRSIPGRPANVARPLRSSVKALASPCLLMKKLHPAHSHS